MCRSIKKKKYKVKVLDPKGNFINEIRKIKPKIVFNALHGRFGEDGYIQSILDAEKIKYTHSGVLASSIAIDKEISKKIFIKNKINTPKFFVYNFNNSLNISFFAISCNRLALCYKIRCWIEARIIS